MPEGRPTEYKPEYIQQIEEYLQTCGREQTKLPKRVDVALLLDCDDETLIEWGEKYPEFSATLKKVDHLQKSELMDDGMFGGKEINPGMAIFLLKANHGMVETERHEHSGPGGLPIPVINVLTYGNTDPLQLQSQRTKPASDPRFETSGKIPSPQLAQESTQDNLSDQPTGKVG